MSHQKVPFTEMLKGIPGFFGIHVGEKPHYRVIEKIGPIEIRSYEPLTLAQVMMPGDYDSFREKAFQVLADYIFGANSTQEEIPMTTPVLQHKSGFGTRSSLASASVQNKNPSGWTMAFILPHQFTPDTAPIPIDPSVRIIARPQKLVAVVTYHGNNNLEKMEDHQKELRDWLMKTPRLQAISDPYFAQYDQPATLPFLKKNEVQVEVQSAH